MTQTEIDWPARIATMQYAICNAGIRPWPYPHIVLPPGAISLASEMSANMPPNDAYVLLSDLGRVRAGLYASRRVITPEMAGKGEWEGAQFWRDCFAAFGSPDLAEMLLTMFAGIIAARITPGQNDIEADMLLVRDGNGYKIGPHTDSPKRLMSCLFYIGNDEIEAAECWGTSIYTPKDRTFRCAGGPHYPFDQFHRVATAPFVQGGGVIFAKTDNSFHGVEPIAVRPGAYRDVLLLDYRVKA